MYNPEEFFTLTQGKEMEMMFYIPEGKGEKLVFEMDIAGILSIKQDVEAKVNGENVYRVLLYSSASEIITGTSGAVLNIPLITSDDMMEGNYTISISNINLTI